MTSEVVERPRLVTAGYDPRWSQRVKASFNASFDDDFCVMQRYFVLVKLIFKDVLNLFVDNGHHKPPLG